MTTHDATAAIRERHNDPDRYYPACSHKEVSVLLARIDELERESAKAIAWSQSWKGAAQKASELAKSLAAQLDEATATATAAERERCVMLVAAVGDVQNESFAQASVVNDYGRGRRDGLHWAAKHVRDELKSLGIWKMAREALDAADALDRDEVR